MATDSGIRVFIVSIHRWIGVGIGLLFAFLMLSGVILTATEQAQERYIIDTPWVDKSISAMGEDLDYLLVDQRNHLQGTIYMPTRLQPAYGVPSPLLSIEESASILGAGDRVRTPITNYYRLDNFDLVWSFDRTKEPQWLQTLARWHISLVQGTWITAWVGYAGAAISLLGIYLWWPWRKGFRLRRALVPQDGSRTQLINYHAAGGIVSVLFLFSLGLSGALLAQRGPVLDIVSQLEGPQAQMSAVPALASTNTQWFSWSDMIALAHEQMPGATLASVSLPRTSNALDFRFRSEGDLSQFGASHVYINPWNLSVESSYRVENASIWRWLFAQLRPIHTGENMPHWFVIVLVLGSCIGGFVVSAGVISFIRKTLGAQPKRPVIVATGSSFQSDI